MAKPKTKTKPKPKTKRGAPKKIGRVAGVPVAFRVLPSSKKELERRAKKRDAKNRRVDPDAPIVTAGDLGREAIEEYLETPEEKR